MSIRTRPLDESNRIFRKKRAVFFYQRNPDSINIPSPGTTAAIAILRREHVIPSVVLDAGCGNGRNSLAFFLEFGSKVLLLDKNPKILKEASNILFQHGSEDHEVLAMTVESLPTVNLGSVDVVVCSYVLQHVFPSYHLSILEYFWKVARKLVIVEIYANPRIYVPGTYTLNHETGWYGFTRKEMLEKFSRFFEILHEKASWQRNAPSTLSLVGKPKEHVGSVSQLDAVVETPIFFSPRGASRVRSLIGLHDRKRRSRQHGRTKKSRSPFFARQLFSKDSSFEPIYPPCQTCILKTCLGYNCYLLLNWVNDLEEVSIEELGGLQLRQELRLSEEEILEDFLEFLGNLGISKDELSILRTRYDEIRNDHPSFRMESVLYHVSRTSGIPIMLEEFVSYFGTESKVIIRESARMRKVLGDKPLPVPIEKYLSRFCRHLGVPLEKCLEILRKFRLERPEIVRSLSPLVIASGIVYAIGSIELGFSQQAVAQVMNVSTVSIRKVIHELDYQWFLD